MIVGFVALAAGVALMVADGAAGTFTSRTRIDAP
jgi:hypothetical protein